MNFSSMKKLFLLLGGFLIYLQGVSNILYVDNSLTPLEGPDIYATYAAAEAVAVSGDTIMIMPSNTAHASITMTKPVHIIGPGFRSQIAGGQQAELSTITIQGTAGGGSITGLYLPATAISYGGVGGLLDGMVIQNCFVRTISFTEGAGAFDNVTITNNVIGSNINTSATEAVTMLASSGTSLITNNIIYGNETGTGAISASFIDITNNVFVGGGADANYVAFSDVTGANINNNIFYGRSPESSDAVNFISNVFADNLTFTTSDDDMSISLVGNSGPGVDFQTATDPEFVNLPLSTDWSNSYDANVEATSPALTFGIGLNGSFIHSGVDVPYFESIEGTNLSQQGDAHAVDIIANTNSGLDIEGAEFFFNYQDLGVGANTPLAISNAVPITQRITIPGIEGFTPGFYNVHLRLKDENGWGFPQGYIVQVLQEEAFISDIIDAAEYYFDEDPGIGAGTEITFTSNDTITFNELIDTAPLSLGFHVLYVRVKNQAGNWGLPQSTLVFVDPSGADVAKIVDAAEYYIDHDPGYGLANPITVAAPASMVDLAQSISTDALSHGFHQLFIRVFAEGSWGLPESRMIYVDPSGGGEPVVIDQIEYYFDADPGYGSGTLLNIGASANLINTTDAIATDALTPGFHILYIRGRSVEGVWGLPEQRLVYVDALDQGMSTDVEAIEYFFDDDPGFGAGIEIATTPDSVVEIISALASSGLSSGIHTVTIRPRDTDGNWGLGETMQFGSLDPGREMDSLALRTLYNFTNGDLWDNNVGWLSGDIDTWFGVTMSGDRVDSLQLPDNNLDGIIPLAISYMDNLKKLEVQSNTLKGDIPTEFTDLTSLLSLRIHDNELSGLPDLSSLTSIVEASLDSNLFDFGDLEPNVGLTGISYTNQKLPGDEGGDSIVSIGNSITIPVDVFGSSNNYQWYQNGEIRAGETAKDLNIAGFLPTDTGTFFLEVTNDIVTDLTINSNNYRLKLSDFEQDSMAMVSIYENLGGTSWTDDTNWLTGSLDSWNGVTMSNGRVTSLSLPSNNLAGKLPRNVVYADSLITVDLSDNGILDTIPANLSELSYLETLNVASNEIRSFPDLNAITGLNDLDISGNRIQFGDMEVNLGVPTFTYAPQDSILFPMDTLVDVETDLVYSLPLTGGNNIYQWKKNGVDFSTTEDLTIGNIAQTDEGQYRLEITNSLVTGLTLYTSTFDLLVSSRSRDSTALHSFYDSTQGPSWTDNTNWTTGDIDTWFGVTVTNNRVTEIDLHDNAVTGRIPEKLRDITGLEVLDVSSNEITYVPQIVNLRNISDVDVSENHLGFAEILLNDGIDTYNYSPQKSLEPDKAVDIQVREDLLLEANVSGVGNNYQWFYEGSEITDALSDTLFVDSLNISNMGDYEAEITNPNVPGLVISSGVTTARAVTDVFGVLFENNGTTTLGSGDVSLYRTVESGPWDSLGNVSINGSGEYLFDDVLLGDYVLLARPNKNSDPELLQTYSGSTIFWEEADTIFLRDIITSEDIVMQTEPDESSTGDSEVTGSVETNIDEEARDGRLETGRRVRRASVMLRRRPPTSKPEDDDGFVLIATIESDDLGEFRLVDLPPGTYRINIEFPGVPMNPDSDIEFELGTDFNNEDATLLALIEESGISITLEYVAGVRGSLISDIKVYPNPGTDRAQLQYLLKYPDDEVSIRIIDNQGRVHDDLVKKGIPGVHKVDLDLSDLVSGIYHVSITNSSGTYVGFYRFLKE